MEAHRRTAAQRWFEGAESESFAHLEPAFASRLSDNQPVMGSIRGPDAARHQLRSLKPKAPGPKGLTARARTSRRTDDI
jgi:hypothetical protein